MLVAFDTHKHRAFGVVYRAVHKETGFQIAIKIIKGGGNDPDIKREIELMRQLRNSNTVSYYGIYVRGDDIWSTARSEPQWHRHRCWPTTH